MATGDVISVISGAAGAMTYQPAVGVEIIILKNNCGSDNMTYGITDGVNFATSYFQASTRNYDSDAIGNRVCITNTNYYTNNSPNNTGFSGIQIK
jgi:hypothetical protein